MCIRDRVCSHLIVGLPGEGQAECLQTRERVVETGVDGIKLHPLHIVKGSIMAKAWEAGRLNGIELEDYTPVSYTHLRSLYLSLVRRPDARRYG